MREMLARHCDGLACLGIATHAGRSIVKRKAPETANLDTMTAGQRLGHLLQQCLDRHLDIRIGEMLLVDCQGFDQFRLSHWVFPAERCAPVSRSIIVKVIY